MPAPGTGYGYAVMGTDAFDDLPETANFTTKLEAEYNQPIIRFVYDGFIYDDYVINAPTITRGGDIVAGTCNIILSNTAKARIDSVGIAFVDGGVGANTDTITDSGNGFVSAGFLSEDKFSISGSTSNDGDYTVYSVAAGTITIIEDGLSNEAAGDLVTVLGEPRFNFFVEDRINTLGKPCHVGLYFSGTLGILYLLTGTVEDVSYNGATITLSIRDAMAPLLEKRIGSGQGPIDYYTQGNPYNPATLVWKILTEYGELDDTESTFNTQIDYTSWQAWHTRCAVRTYQCKARFPGTTIQNALLRIGDLTNSFIWVDGEDKFQFAMFEPPYVAGVGDETYDLNNAVDIDIDIDKSTVKNIITIYYGHDPDANYGPSATIAGVTFDFNNVEPDTIFTAPGGFLEAGFDANDPISVSGSRRNDGEYGVASVTDTLITLPASSGLTDENAGATVTLSQTQDTSTMEATTLAFVNSNPDTITDSNGGFITSRIDDDNTITVSGSSLNDGTYTVDSVSAGTLTLAIGADLSAESAGSIVTLTQIHTKTITGATIAFEDNETGGDDDPPDLITKSDGGLSGAGFDADYTVTVSGSTSNDGTYRLSGVAATVMTLQKQTLVDEDAVESGETVYVTITQNHSDTGLQFAGSYTDTSAASITLYGDITLTEEDKVVWHDNLASATVAAVAKLLIYRYPGEFARIAGTMVGFLSSIGDEIHVTEAYKNIDDMTYYIKETSIDLETGLVDITAERGR